MYKQFVTPAHTLSRFVLPVGSLDGFYLIFIFNYVVVGVEVGETECMVYTQCFCIYDKY